MYEPTLHYVTCPGGARAVVRPQPQQGPQPEPLPPISLTHRMAYWEWNQTGDPAHPHVVLCVHGLTRQGRDFDALARALSLHARVICPDVAGRGHSDWLADPLAYAVPQYVADMLALLGQLGAASTITTLDWVGTSMGGLIGMAVAGLPHTAASSAEVPARVDDAVPPVAVLPLPVRRLVINDVGPAIEWAGLQRIAAYTGQPVRFESLQQAAHTLRLLSSGFGPLTDAQWLELTGPMLRPLPDDAGGGFGLHYDPAIAVPMRGMTRAQADAAQALLWQVYGSITARTLLLRGAQSDILSAATAQAMTQRGPRAQCVEIPGTGHAPMLVDEGQIAIVRDFLFA